MKKITLSKTKKSLSFMSMIFFLSSILTAYSQKHNFREIKITEPICVYHPDPEPYDKSKIENLRF